jgi:hypothetical protein
MEKEKEQKEVQEQPQTPNFDLWHANMRGKYGDDKTDEELYALSMSGYDAEHDAVKRYSAEAEELENILAANPDLAGVFAEIFTRGKDGNPAGALRNLPDELKRYITDENYGDEEYLADRKAKEEEATAKKAKDEQTQALREQAFEEVCKEDGVVEPEAALEALQGVFNNPCETLEQCKEQVRSFLKMVDYDNAVEAAEVRGRNANITAQRKKTAGSTDGQANSTSAAGSAKAQNNPLARMAETGLRARNL